LFSFGKLSFVFTFLIDGVGVISLFKVALVRFREEFLDNLTGDFE